MKMGGTRINHYNDLIQKYFYVICDDSTENYMGKDKIDMEEICVV